MHLLLFSIFAISIAGSRTQEIAIGTEYLRAHMNGSLPSESAINAQGLDSIPSLVVIGDTPSTPSTTTASGSAKDESSEHEDEKKKDFDHEHHAHHDHNATITVDFHNVLDIINQKLQEMETRIIAAINRDPPAIVETAPKSYRTADR